MGDSAPVAAAALDPETGPGSPRPGASSYVVLCGSPRVGGRSARLAREIAGVQAAAHPRDYVVSLSVADADVHGCVGCGACRTSGECVFDDDMASIWEVLADADELHLVSPVYFAGPPSQLKAVLDRLQPHYWRGTRRAPKRPAHLHVVGEGGDPHGFEPLVTICRSALAVAGFRLETITPHIEYAEGDAAPAYGRSLS